MYVLRIHRPRTFLLTILIFAFIFVLVLNVLVHQLHGINSSRYSESAEDQKVLYLDLGKLHPKFGSYAANGLRKPKAADEKVQYESDPETDYNTNENQNVKQVKVYKFQSQNEIPSVKVKNLNDKSEEDYDDDDNTVIDDKDKDDVDINKVVIDEIEEEDDNDDDYEYEDKENSLKFKHVENRIFEPYDFKNMSKMIFTKPPLKYEELSPQEKSLLNARPDQPWKEFSFPGKSLVRDGIYWTPEAERLIPKENKDEVEDMLLRLTMTVDGDKNVDANGFTDEEALQYIKNVQSQSVKRLSPPTWDHCGRPKNAYLTLQNGLNMCGRYRHPHIKLVLGEVLSFYLSRLLKMDNVPAVVLSLTDTSSPQWSNTDIHTLQWESDKLVALIQWIPNLESFKSAVKIPTRILKAYQKNTHVTSESLIHSNLSHKEVMQLVQWGTMFVFDFLTGNYDRVASMQDAAEDQKNPKIILDNIRNLFKSTKTSKLWLIDNESGLLDAYDLLYQTVHNGDRFIKFHKQMLQTMCIFQKSVADAIRELNSSSSPHSVLYKYAMSHDPVLRKVLESSNFDMNFEVLDTNFALRIREVYKWIQYCEQQVSR